MALFGRRREPGRTQASQRQPSFLPADIVPVLAEYGRARCFGECEIFEPGPFEEHLRGRSPEAQRAWLRALSSEVMAAGGWALCGAADVVMKAMDHPVELPEYRALLDAELEFQRAGGLWESQLSSNEKLYWRKHHPDEPWMIPSELPSRAAAFITPLPVGEERKLSVMSSASNSKAIYVAHVRVDTYVWLLDFPDDSNPAGGRLREANGTHESLYDLYRTVGGNMPVPSYWADPEFEAFFPFPNPRM